MDPDTALDNARKALSEYHAAKERRLRIGAEHAAEALVEAFESIDQWMTSGGFPPRGWTKVEPPCL